MDGFQIFVRLYNVIDDRALPSRVVVLQRIYETRDRTTFRAADIVFFNYAAEPCPRGDR